MERIKSALQGVIQGLGASLTNLPRIMSDGVARRAVTVIACGIAAHFIGHAVNTDQVQQYVDSVIALWGVMWIRKGAKADA